MIDPHFDLAAFLAANVKPALGCTEVVVIGLASNIAWQAAQGKLPSFLTNQSPKIDANQVATGPTQITKIEVELDRNVFKNALAVNIPIPDSLLNQTEKGIEFAAALGIFCQPAQSAQNLLTLFASIDESLAQKAKELKRQIKTVVQVVDSWTGQADLNVMVKINFSIGGVDHWAAARIQHRHDQITEVQVDGQMLFQAPVIDQTVAKTEADQLKMVAKMELAELVAVAANLSPAAGKILQTNLDLNLQLAAKGLAGQHGMKLGAQLHKLIDQGLLADDLINHAKMLAAAAADARMGGAMLAAMSTAGSGNQGITASVPLIAVAQKLAQLPPLAANFKIKANANQPWTDLIGRPVDQPRLFSALALSHLVTNYIAYYSGHLSALCGCAVKAGIGVAAGLTYYLGGTVTEISQTINLMAANITGMICDGAKEGCALKLATATESAVSTALLAVNGLEIPADNGLINQRVEQTMQNIGKISAGMIKTDQVIVQETMLTK